MVEHLDRVSFEYPPPAPIYAAWCRVVAMCVMAAAGLGCDRRPPHTEPTSPTAGITRADVAASKSAKEVEFWGIEDAPFLVEGRLYLGDPEAEPVDLGAGDLVVGHDESGEVKCSVKEIVEEPAVRDCPAAVFAELDCPRPPESPFVGTATRQVVWYRSVSPVSPVVARAAEKLRATEAFQKTVERERRGFAEDDLTLHVVLDDDVRAFEAPDSPTTYGMVRFALSENEDGGYYADSAAGPAGGYVEAMFRVVGEEVSLLGDVKTSQSDRWLDGGADLDGDGDPEFLRETHDLGSSLREVVDPIADETGRVLKTCGPMP